MSRYDAMGINAIVAALELAPYDGALPLDWRIRDDLPIIKQNGIWVGRKKELRAWKQTHGYLFLELQKPRVLLPMNSRPEPRIRMRYGSLIKYLITGRR
ncbi:MAG: hypothetical protein JW943_04640 [Deltaproteobacteria bacterium]|nr:hypothetical protein [Deltaproteobacteria bacterium]